MAPNLILYAIPMFFVLIGVELAWARMCRKKLYRFSDSINDLSMGISDQVFAVVQAGAGFGIWLFLYHRFRLFTLPSGSAWVWIGALVVKDFLYYWAHRLSHEVNILWAGHAPHHQSEEFNLAVALRQGAFQGPLTMWVYWPMAILGFPPLVYLTISQLVTLYQFFIHTRAVGSLGPLELVLNTPSHHRVHHGKNPKYLDKNHAGTFIIWDRLFGTFQKEEEEPLYGTLQPLRSWNPLWGQVQYLVYLARLGWRSPRRGDLFRIWFKQTGWTPEKGAPPDPALMAIEPGFREKYDPYISKGLMGYVFLQFVMVLIATVCFLAVGKQLHDSPRIALMSAVLLSILSLGGILEARRWALWLELVRLFATVAAIAAWRGPLYGGLSLLAATGLGLWLVHYRNTLTNQPGALPAPAARSRAA